MVNLLDDPAKNGYRKTSDEPTALMDAVNVAPVLKLIRAELNVAVNYHVHTWSERWANSLVDHLASLNLITIKCD
jgi:hypothetical protein